MILSTLHSNMCFVYLTSVEFSSVSMKNDLCGEFDAQKLFSCPPPDGGKVSLYSCEPLDSSNNHARLLFVDFSSTFNTKQPHLLIQKLTGRFGLDSDVVGWILHFLTYTKSESKWSIFLAVREIHCLSPCVPVSFTVYIAH